MTTRKAPPAPPPAHIHHRRTFGERLADDVATFGGSWKFILTFLGFMAVWMGMNVWQLVSHPFDPYPFILLNLVLSCLASLQAPIIMMSQNRQEMKDRLRAEKDLAINLKAEREICEIQDKLERVLRLLEKRK